MGPETSACEKSCLDGDGVDSALLLTVKRFDVNRIERSHNLGANLVSPIIVELSLVTASYGVVGAVSAQLMFVR
jgi:hypothetical protein